MEIILAPSYSKKSANLKLLDGHSLQKIFNKPDLIVKNIELIKNHLS